MVTESSDSVQIILSSVSSEAGRLFQISLKGKTNEPETNFKSTNIRDLYRGIITLKKCYQVRTNIVNLDQLYLLAESTILGTGRSKSSVSY
jgi:pyruvate-formate lyase